MYLIAAASGFGFLFSLDKMVLIFGSWWGTNTDEENASISKLVYAISFAVVVGVAVWLIRYR